MLACFPNCTSPADGSKHLLCEPHGSSSNDTGLECLIVVFCFQPEEINCKQSNCATRNRQKKHGNHGNIAAIRTEELSRSWNKTIEVTRTEWHEKHFGGIVIVVTERDHYLQCRKSTTFRAA